MNLYNAVEEIDPNTEIGWWRCNEEEGVDCLDSSSNGVHGENQGDLGSYFSAESPFSRYILPTGYETYVPCAGGIVAPGESPIGGTPIPGLELFSDQLVWAMKVK